MGCAGRAKHFKMAKKTHPRCSLHLMNSIFGGMWYFSLLVIQHMKKDADPVYATVRLLLKLLIGFIGVLEDQMAVCSFSH